MCADTVEQIDKEIIIAKNFPLLLVFLSVTITTSYLSTSVSLSVVRRLPQVIITASFNINSPGFHYSFKTMSINYLPICTYYMSSWGFQW